MTTFTSLVKKYALDKEATVYSHQSFAGKIVKLYVPAEEKEKFYIAYVDYLKELTMDQLKIGSNSIVERIKPTFNFFLDLDLKMEFFEKNILDNKTGKDNDIQREDNDQNMQDIQREDNDQNMQDVTGNDIVNISSRVLLLWKDIFDAFCGSISDAIGVPKYSVSYVTAFRMFYKCHVVFQDIVVDSNTARILCEDVNEKLKVKYPWIIEHKIIDTSVYTSGLRMIASHKGSMDKKGTEFGKHEKLFPSIPYEHSYRVGEIVENENEQIVENENEQKNENEDIDNNDGTKTLSIRFEDSLTLESVLNCSIIAPSSSEKITLRDEYVPLRDATIKKPSYTIVPSTDDPVSMDIDQYEVVGPIDEKLMFLVREYVENCLQSHGMSSGTMKTKFMSNDTLTVTLPPQKCPMSGDLHSRCTRSCSVNYIIISPFDSKMKCWSKRCDGKSVNLKRPGTELVNMLINRSSDYSLKHSLYKQTDEVVSEYVFSILKDKHATARVKASSYIWYYFNQLNHRWENLEMIYHHIMKEHEIVHSSYQDFVDRQLAIMTEEDSTVLKKKWSTLSGKLQTTAYVRGCLLPLLARKLEMYWRGFCKGITFQSMLDSNPELLGFNNGVWDLHNNEFRDGRPFDFISMSTETCYMSYESFPEKLKTSLNSFLTKIFPKEDHLQYVLQEIALALNGSQRTQKFFFWTGRGANGKSTLIKLINCALGMYAGEVNVTMFTQPAPASNVPAPQLIAIKGKRIISSAEPNARDHFNLGSMKWYTGGDRITAAEKHECNQSFYLQSTFICSCNDIPAINTSKDDWGTWRRLITVLFGQRFSENPKGAEVRADPEITKNIASFNCVFMSLLIEIYLKSTTETKKIPLEFVQLNMQLQDKNDHYGRFIKECLEDTSLGSSEQTFRTTLRSNQRRDDESRDESRDDEYDDENEDEFEETPFTESKNLYHAFVRWLEGMNSNKKVNITYDHFEKYISQLLGPIIEIEECDKKGWNVRLKPIIHY